VVLRDVQLDKLAEARWRGRTDLLWLAKHVLGYKDVDQEVHGPLADKLQHFTAPPPHLRHQYDFVGPTEIKYLKPWVPMDSLPEGRRRLILDPRGFYKTTLNVIAHTVQWILNYPDVAILVVHARQETAEEMLSELKSHFVYGRVLRDLYPEYCFREKDAGNRTKFTVPNRERKQRKESTVAVASMESSVAGMHCDVIKFTDVVDGTNTATKEQCRKIIYNFNTFKNILVKPTSWIDVEGTCWHQADLYTDIIDKHRRSAVEDRQWSIHVRGVYKKKVKDGRYTFLPEERELDDLLDEKGNKVSWFPAKFPVHELRLMQQDDGEVFSCQQLNNPVSSEQQYFPLTLFRTKTPEDLRKVPMAYYTTSVDTAETQKRSSDYSVVLTCGWDAKGRCYVVDARHGKYLPDELISQIFDVYRVWRPRSIRIEETGYVRGLKTSIRRYEDMNGVYLPFAFITPDNQKSKEERIAQTLQPWYKRGEIYFAGPVAEGKGGGLSCLEHFKVELSHFPKGNTDDLVDALADQFVGKTWLGREVARPQHGEQTGYSQADNDAEVRARLKKLMEKAQADKVNGEGAYASAHDQSVNGWTDFFNATGGL